MDEAFQVNKTPAPKPYRNDKQWHLDEIDKYPDIEGEVKTMSNTYNLNGPTSLFGTLTRILVLTIAAIGGVFMLAFSAAVAFFVLVGVALVGLLAFGFFWVRAKLFGKPFGPKAQFEARANKMRADLEAQMNPSASDDGPIIDAHRTPDGWSVDD